MLEESHGFEKFKCTAKFQGDGDYHWVEKIADVPKIRVVHFFYNKLSGLEKITHSTLNPSWERKCKSDTIWRPAFSPVPPNR